MVAHVLARALCLLVLLTAVAAPARAANLSEAPQLSGGQTRCAHAPLGGVRRRAPSEA
ncbi:MAG: hypothetical protein QM775_33710 [Pirellulales bacterium]